MSWNVLEATGKGMKWKVTEYGGTSWNFMEPSRMFRSHDGYDVILRQHQDPSGTF